jgi:hypothetical protein
MNTESHGSSEHYLGVMVILNSECDHWFTIATRFFFNHVKGMGGGGHHYDCISKDLFVWTGKGNEGSSSLEIPTKAFLEHQRLCQILVFISRANLSSKCIDR